MTPSGIDTAIFRFVAQCLNHYCIKDLFEHTEEDKLTVVLHAWVFSLISIHSNGLAPVRNSSNYSLLVTV
jgi:hypothetical protein